MIKSVCFLGPFFFAIWDHLEEFLRCGDLKLRCVRFGETAWHVSCDLGLRCETALRSAAICVARCEIAKVITIVIFLISGKYREKTFGFELPQGWGHVHARTQEQFTPGSALWREAIDE